MAGARVAAGLGAGRLGADRGRQPPGVEARDRPRDGIGDRLLELGGAQPLLLVGVRDERDLDEDGRHRGADEDAERRLLDPAAGRVRNGIELDLDRLGDLGGLLEVGALRQVPEDEVEVGVAGVAAGPAAAAPPPFASFSRLATSWAILSEASSER